VTIKKSLETVARVGAYAALGSAGAALAWVGLSSLAINHRRKLRPAIPNAHLKRFESGGGELAYYADTAAEGRPLLLLHSLNAAASSIEMKPLFERYRGTRPVYALDLPGFGFSSRADRPYTIDLYKQAIIDMIDKEISGEHPVDVIALSVSSEFTALATLESPHSFRSVTMISPTGFGEQQYRGVSIPLARQAYYDLVTSRLNIRYSLNKSFMGPVPRELIEYGYETSHQPGARFAPLAFLSGELFTADVNRHVYNSLEVPVLAIYDPDGYVSFEELEPFVRNHMNWVSVRLSNTRGMPHWEHLTDTAATLEYFWKDTVPVIGAAMGRDTERTSACASVKTRWPVS
jgi:pimeloyl-ACP methyl ester carboxylesterase